LIPTLKQEEESLQAMLEQARKEAERRVGEAGRNAEERVEAVRRELPQLMERQRGHALERIEAQADIERQSADKKARKLEENARGNMGAAVAYILSAIRPKG